jgi:hypothetical protein
VSRFRQLQLKGGEDYEHESYRPVISYADSPNQHLNDTEHSYDTNTCEDDENTKKTPKWRHNTIRYVQTSEMIEGRSSRGNIN